MKSKYITVLDFEIGRVFQYKVENCRDFDDEYFDSDDYETADFNIYSNNPSSLVDLRGWRVAFVLSSSL